MNETTSRLRAFLIGEAARRANVTVKAIRYYERTSLIPKAPRRGTYRVYDDDTVRRRPARFGAAGGAGLAGRSGGTGRERTSRRMDSRRSSPVPVGIPFGGGRTPHRAGRRRDRSVFDGDTRMVAAISLRGRRRRTSSRAWSSREYFPRHSGIRGR